MQNRDESARRPVLSGPEKTRFTRTKLRNEKDCSRAVEAKKQKKRRQRGGISRKNKDNGGKRIIPASGKSVDGS